ncbi:lysine transporter LysE [Pantoea agglomerans Eh318]|nr:lysine transporter LysE [Pantoea agglomerans Eh318]
MAYTVLKVCGAVYLSWLGLQLLIRPRSSFSDGDDNNVSQGSWFIRGMLGNVLNPKMGIFYVSFLPQFIPAGHSPLIWTFILVSIHVAIGTIWSVTLILSTHFASAVLKKSRVVRVMDRATGGLFLCFAAKLAISTK